MFRLSLPTPNHESPLHNSSFSADDHLSSPPESSRSLLEFDEDEVSSSSAGSGQENDAEEDEEQIDQHTMEALFDDAAREAIRAYEEQLNLEDDEWLLHHKGDADAVAKDLTEREIRKQKKLYLLRRQKFYELGGRKKARNIMARYGITHLKLLKEHHDASSNEVDTVLTHPRVVATALLRRLRYGNENLRIDWLKDYFAVMAEKQRADFDVLKFVDATGIATTTANAPTISQKPQAKCDTTDHSVVALDTPAQLETPEVAIAIPEEPNATEQCSAARRPSSFGAAEDTLAYIRRQKAAAMSQNTALLEAGIPLDSTASRPPFGSVDENSFVRGFRVFFETLAQIDRERIKSEATERSVRRHAASPSLTVAEQRFDIHPGASSCARALENDQGDRSRSDRHREQFFNRVTKALYETTEAATTALDSAPASPAASVAASFRCGGVESSLLLEGEEGEPAAADFLSREGEVADAGFRFLFGAVDANDCGSVAWERLIEYLLDASLLVKGSDSTDLDSRSYEFLKDHTNSYFHDLNDVCMIGPREMMAVAGTHVTLVSNRASLDFVERNTIKSPLDPFTLAPYYKVTALTYMTSAKMLAVGTSDNTVRVFMIHTSTRPTLIASAKVDANIRCVLWFKDLLFAGTRQGSLFSFQLVKSKRSGWELNLVRHTVPHRSFITRIVPIPTENCVCTSSLDKSMIIHDAKTLKPIFTFPQEHRAGILEMCYCDCINGLVTVSFDTQILVWNVSLLHNRPLPMWDRVRPHTGTIMSVACIEHSAAVVTLCSRGMIKLWSLRSCLCTQTLNVGPHVPMFDAGAKFFRVLVHHCRPSVVLPLGSTQLFVFSRRRLYAFEYNLSQRSIVLRNTADDDPLVAVGYNYVEQLYVTFSTSSVKSWDCATCTIRDSFRCPEVADAGGISAAYLHPNGRAYFLGTHRGCIFVKNFSTGTTLHFTRCHLSSACIGLRFCFAAPVPARLKAATSAAIADVQAADDGGRPRPTSTAMAKAGLGDIVVSISDNSAFVLTHDLRTRLSLDGLDGPRCVDHDPQSSLIIVGDCTGMISVYLQANLSSVRNLPHHILQMPKRVPREVSALCVMHGLSALIAADEEGTIGMFSLKHHPRPFSCVGVWSHVSDSSSGASSTISAAFFFPAKYLVYIGDEAGSVSVYNLRDAFIASQQGSTGSVPGGAIDAFSSKAVLRPKKSGRSPRSTFPNTPTSSAGRRTPQESPRTLRVGSPRGFSSPIGSPTHALGGSFASSSRRGRPNLLAAPSVSDATRAVVAYPEIDYRAVGGMVEVVNRFTAHLDAVTCILVVSPENSNLTSESAADVSADPAAIHTALMTASQDQCCCGWRLAGTYHLGSLEQYGRCRVPTQTPAAADDLRTLVTRREGQQLEARRDTIRIRSRGLVRLAGTNVLSTIPARFLARAAAAAPQPPTSSTTATQAPVIPSPRSTLLLDASFASGGGSVTEFSAVTPRSARLQRMVAQGGPELVIRPEIPNRLLMGVQEYHKFVNRRRKSLRQLNDAAKSASVPTHDSLVALAGQQEGVPAAKEDDPETLSQLLSEYAHGSDYNSVLDELFSVAPASLGDIAVETQAHGSNRLNRHGSTHSLATSAASTSASTIVNRMRNLTTGLQNDLMRTAGAVERSLVHDMGGAYQHCQAIAPNELRFGACKMNKGRMDLRIRRVRSGVPQHAQSSEMPGPIITGNEAGDESSFGAHESSVTFGRRDTAAYPSSFRHGHSASATPPPGGGPQSSTISRASSSRASTSSRPPVVVATSYIAPTRTFRDAATADGKKDRRLGYHTGTLESYRSLARCSPVVLPPQAATQVTAAEGEAPSQSTIASLNHHDASSASPHEENNTSSNALSGEGPTERCAVFNGAAAAPEALVLSRESLERLLPPSPLRKKVIQLLLEFGPKLRKELTVEMSVCHKQRLLRQLVFQNKPLKEIANDSVVVRRLAGAWSRVPPRPSTAPTADARSPPKAERATVTAEQELAEHWDSYWDQYCTTMFPPPPQFPVHDAPQPQCRRRAASAPRSPVHISKTELPVALNPSGEVLHITSHIATSIAAADRESPNERFQTASSVGTALRRGGLAYSLQYALLQQRRTFSSANSIDSVEHDLAKIARAVEAATLVDKPLEINCGELVHLPKMKGGQKVRPRHAMTAKFKSHH